jgi:hypothetical protein
MPTYRARDQAYRKGQRTYKKNTSRTTRRQTAKMVKRKDRAGYKWELK